MSIWSHPALDVSTREAKSMLEDLWYGNITPFEDFLDGRKEYKELM